MCQIFRTYSFRGNEYRWCERHVQSVRSPYVSNSKKKITELLIQVIKNVINIIFRSCQKFESCRILCINSVFAFNTFPITQHFVLNAYGHKHLLYEQYIVEVFIIYCLCTHAHMYVCRNAYIF